MMSDFRGGGGSKITQKNRTLEGKNWTLGGGGGVKNRRKSSDIIYARSLMLLVASYNQPLIIPRIGMWLGSALNNREMTWVTYYSHFFTFHDKI